MNAHDPKSVLNSQVYTLFLKEDYMELVEYIILMCPYIALFSDCLSGREEIKVIKIRRNV
ncbi:hypothetical protein IFM47457_05550 [Aspergillus lentulus]|nr:hypothetical protein IFM47457_05550 [Aspergillus lentulus]